MKHAKWPTRLKYAFIYLWGFAFNKDFVLEDGTIEKYKNSRKVWWSFFTSTELFWKIKWVPWEEVKAKIDALPIKEKPR